MGSVLAAVTRDLILAVGLFGTIERQDFCPDMARIDKDRQSFVRDRARGLCEYCHSPETLSFSEFQIDHIEPRSAGGSDDPDNLALACSRCNARKNRYVTGRQTRTRLFHPRRDRWADHFIWSADGTRIQTRTPIGRATRDRLDLNDDRRNNRIVRTRAYFVSNGDFPPAEDPRKS